MLRTRIVTASVMAVLFLSLLLLTPAPVFLVVVVAVIAVAAWEWANFANVLSPAGRLGFAALVVIVATAVGYLSHHIQLFPALHIFYFALAWWLLALVLVKAYPALTAIWQPPLVRLIIGGVVLVPAAIGIYDLRIRENGEFIVLALVVVVAAADIGAYFSGKSFGKRKLAPNVSPGKSWEGVLGGFLLVALIAAGFSLLSASYTFKQAMLIALPTATVSVLGDLLESMFKRQRGIKDSSQLLPGHGGVLDRIDGLLAAIPLFALGLSLWR